MLLSEITILRKSDMRYREVVDLFIDKHKLDIEGGSHADVFVPPGKSYVWRAWTNDPGFESFIKYIEKHKDNPHLPKLLSRVREEPLQLKGVPKDVTLKFIKIEKLTPIKDGDLRSALRKLEGNNPKAAEIKFPEGYESFFTTIIDLVKHGADDIDHTNVMMRGDVPVITDPAHRPLS